MAARSGTFILLYIGATYWFLLEERSKADDGGPTLWQAELTFIHN